MRKPWGQRMQAHLGLESLQAYPFPTPKGRALKGISARGKALGATPAASCPHPAWVYP